MKVPSSASGQVSEQTYNPIHNAGRALHEAAAQMTRAVDRRAKNLGISGAQWMVLIRIGGNVANTASDLCKMLGYDSGAMTRMLDRLEKLGLIERSPSDEDRRVMIVSLTDAGRTLYPQITPIAVDVIEEHLRGFSAEDIVQLIGFLDRIRTNGEAQS